MAGAIGAAIRVATEQWRQADPPAPLEQLLREAINQFARGLSAP